MGSYAECWIGSFYVGSTKNDIDPGLMQLFRSSDKQSISAKKGNLPFQLHRWVIDIEDEEDVSVICYRAPVRVIKDRLELIGYTLETAKSAFTISMKAEAALYKKWAQGDQGHIFKKTASILERLNADSWLAALAEVKGKGLQQRDLGGDTKSLQGSLLGHMLDTEWYGYTGPDRNVGLRLALEVCEESDELIYDLTDLVLGGYFSSVDDLVEYSISLSASEYSSIGKIIVLTEGRSDSRVLSESLELLFPHLSDYFRFIDFDEARVSGGAGNLANIVKVFAGAGIINKVIALFDNDTAAESSLKSLRFLNLPKNIRIRKLPHLAALQSYPTIGPSGMVTMNVNGIAGSIELYLGSDVLVDESGNLTPVQWTGYDSSLGKYQGELLSKNEVQERFSRRIRECRRDSTIIEATDWIGIRAILHELFEAFREFDREDIHSNLESYYA